MDFKRKIFIFSILLSGQSCSNMNVTRVPKYFVTNITNNLTPLANNILNVYKINTAILVDTLKPGETKKKLIDLDIHYLVVSYKIDKNLEVNPFGVYGDSVMIFSKAKNMRYSLDSWLTHYEVHYFFGKSKPVISNYYDKNYEIYKKLNDSIFIRSIRMPNH